jgi:putative regulator of septum formation
MAAPATLGTGAEPDQPVPYPDDDPEYESYAARRMGWFGIIVLAIAVLAVIGAVYVLVNHGIKPKTKVSYEPAAVFGLQAGQCFNGQNGLGVTVLSCSSPHQAEVFATFLLTAQAWPGDNAVQAAAQAGCQTRISSYMNPQLATSALSQEYIYPDEITWSAGIRTVICDVRSDEGLVTGSVRQP